MEMDIQSVKEYLPQRYPFLFVDRVVELVPDNYIVAYKNVSVNEPFFNGHFPEYPIMPGVLIIEAAAQAAGILGFKSQEKKPKDGYVYYFVGVDKLRLRRPVIPGDKLVLRAEFAGPGRRGIYRFNCEVNVDGEPVASMQIMCAERKLDVN